MPNCLATSPNPRFNFIRKTPEVSVGGIKVQKYSAFLREIVVPTNFNIVSVRPLRGSGLIVCDPTLVFAVIDSLFGGIGNFTTSLGAYYQAFYTDAERSKQTFVFGWCGRRRPLGFR